MTKYVFSSVTRISDLPTGDFAVEPLPAGRGGRVITLLAPSKGARERTSQSSCPMEG